MDGNLPGEINMKIELLNKSKILAMIIVFIGAGFLPMVDAISTTNTDSLINYQDTGNWANEGTEYWALLVAVGVYADDPQQNRPLMLEEVDDLYEVLLESEVWSEDHIRVIKGEDATISNIILGLRWLDRMEDSDDFSLVFITTHGYPLGQDVPPIDEEDGTDEALVSYWGFTYPMLFLWDDELNFLLNRLESQGVCFIVDSCYAGGFNDPPDWNRTNRMMYPFSTGDYEMSAKEWIEEFAEDIRGQGRVVLMASREDEVSFSGGFAPYLIDGLRGFADSNMDDIVSAEEAFYYTEPRTSNRQHPTIYDGYEGELPLINLAGSLQHYEEETEDRTSRDISPSRSIENSGDPPENSVICGYVEDIDTSDPIEDADVEVWGRDTQDNFYENYTTTDLFGFYSINVPAGRFRLVVHADGYCSGSSWFNEIDENETLWINFSLYPRPPENSVVCGYIIDNETGDPIDAANVSLYWQTSQNQYYWNDTASDPTGFFSMNVAAGEIELDVEAEGYFRENLEEYYIEEFEILWANFSLYPRPPENSIVCGYITDNETGDPLVGANVELEWVDFILDHQYSNETHTDSFGFFSMNVAAGELYIDIRKQGYSYYNPYRHDTEVNQTLWINVSLEEETIEIDITKPLRAFYLNNNRIIPFFKARIVGEITIAVDIYESWYWQGQAEKGEFYIDNKLKETITSEPYNWTWSDRTVGRHTIKVVAYDNEGYSVSKEIEVYKFL